MHKLTFLRSELPQKKSLSRRVEERETGHRHNRGRSTRSHTSLTRLRRER